MVNSIEHVAKDLEPDDLFSVGWLQQFCGQNAEQILGEFITLVWPATPI
jgi:hypothetical protein